MMFGISVTVMVFGLLICASTIGMSERVKRFIFTVGLVLCASTIGMSERVKRFIFTVGLVLVVVGAIFMGLHIFG